MSITCADSYDCVCASLPSGPGELEDVKTALIADFASDAIRTLRNWVSVEGQLVIFFNEDVV